MHIDAVVFDMDGTLLDTLADIAHAANAVLTEGGFSPHPVGEYRQFVGEGVKVLFTRALPPGQRQDERVAGCAARFRDIYGGNCSVFTKPYAGIAELLDALTLRDVRMAILSNKPHTLTMRCAEVLLSNWPLHPILGQVDDIPPKPDPAGALEIARQLELPPENCLYLGDTGVDMLTATRAGMLAVGALWGFRGRDELSENGAAQIVEQPAQVLDLVDRMRRIQ